MALYRDSLDHIINKMLLADGGLETDLIFNKGFDLPDFSAFVLLESEAGVRALLDYYQEYVDIAVSANLGIVLETPTWRANPDWAQRLGYDESRLRQANIEGVERLVHIRSHNDSAAPIVVSGCIGPRSDGYAPSALMSTEEARSYHQAQVETFADTEADLVTGMTMGYAEEAIGIATAAKRSSIPVAISFTTETNGLLPSGHSLRDAIESVDGATDGYPSYYMVNCAYPTHFSSVLSSGEHWVKRIRGVRSNASKASHAELDESPTLDSGDPVEFGEIYARLQASYPNFTVLGGCCGTDSRHIRQIALACAREE
ncbi:homocysteine S-methyltransferase family protein [Streptomyces sp. NPDC096153]|uniref:homocysteine S-methyltransferase family protein n=1 Tax=Streptomyces sp. NPDC096153 TaxID=3155548 RepID=UPI0033235206